MRCAFLKEEEVNKSYQEVLESVEISLLNFKEISNLRVFFVSSQ